MQKCAYLVLHYDIISYSFLHCRGPNLTKRTSKQIFFISVFNQRDAQNLFHNKFYFMPLHVSSTFAHHQEVKTALHSL